MPKVSVYLPDELYERVRAQGVSLSGVTQSALEQQLSAAVVDAWVDRVGATAPRLREPVDTTALLDDVRDEFGR